MSSINVTPTCADGDAKKAPPHVIDIENENAVDKQSQDVIVIEDDSQDGMKTPKRQTSLQKVFDLSKESAQATYQWMRWEFYFLWICF